MVGHEILDLSILVRVQARQFSKETLTMKKNNRHYDRTPLSAEVGYRQEKDGLFGGCIAKNVSENGISIRIGEFIHVGTVLDLQFKLPLSARAFVVHGKVVWINKLPYNEQWEAGISLSMDKDFAVLVRKYAASRKP